MAKETQSYFEGIRDGRAMFRRCGPGIAPQEYEKLDKTIQVFPADNPVGQYLRGARDFWRTQIAKGFSYGRQET